MKTDDQPTDWRVTLFGRLVESFDMLSHTFDREMVAEVALPLQWYSVLLHVGRSPGGQCPMSELTGATAFTSGGVTRLVDRIVWAGHVERRSCPHDRRVTYVALTKTGNEILARATEVHVRSIQTHIIDVMGSDQAIELDRLLHLIGPTQVCGHTELLD